MMRRFHGSAFFLSTLSFLLMAAACSKPAPENPFDYSFVKPLHLERQPGKPFSDCKAFYLLTEDFEPVVESASELDSIREVLRFASDLSSKYQIHWTHFVDANALTSAFVSDNQELKQRCQSMIGDLKAMAEAGDDCELHLHGPLNSALIEQLRSQEKLHIRGSREAVEQYRQRRSFFYQSFYRGGYRELVSSLTYGKRLLETSLYDGRKQVLAFRPGGWDHGSSQRDTLLYFQALGDAGLIANSGLSQGDFEGKNWRVGNDPGRNLATVLAGDNKLVEVSPTAGPGGYLNPVLPSDLNKLARSVKGEMAVIVEVYHLARLQRSKVSSNDSQLRSEAELQAEHGALEQHFKTVADLTAAKTLYPITLRELLAIISEQQ
jgi:hypothetical protein